MDGKISRSSILINKDLLPLLIDYIGSLDHEENDKTKFQLVNSLIHGFQISIYRSGMVIYEEVPELISIIEEFFIHNDQEFPQDLKKSRELLQSISQIEPKQQEKYTQSLWLSDLQIQKLIGQLKNLNFKIEIDKTAKIKYRVSDTDDNSLNINSNNIITTNTSHVFFPQIQDIIESYPVETGFDFYLAIESIGLYSQIGPIIITIIGITTNQSVHLQSQGVKHAELGRNIEIEKYQSLISQGLQLKKTVKIYPQEFNLDKSDNILTGTLITLFHDIKENLQSSQNTILYIDKKLHFINSEIIRIFPNIEIEFTNKTMSSAAASIINRIEFDNWIDEISNKYSLKMIKSNLNEINNLEDREKLVKVKYIKNKNRNENNKF